MVWIFVNASFNLSMKISHSQSSFLVAHDSGVDFSRDGGMLKGLLVLCRRDQEMTNDYVGSAGTLDRDDDIESARVVKVVGGCARPGC